MNNLFILLGATLIGIGVMQKPNKKELTAESESDTVQVPNANDVPKPNETETQPNANDDSGLTDGGDAV